DPPLLLPGTPGAAGAAGADGAQGLPGADGAAGAADTTLFFADKPPTTANAVDDEFDDATVSTAWTDFDPAGGMAVSEGDFGLQMVSTYLGAGDQIAGQLKAIPAGDFAWVIKVDPAWERTTTNAASGSTGFIITDGFGATSDIYFFILYWSAVTSHDMGVFHYSQ